MKEFAVKVFFHPVRAHAEYGRGIGAVLVGLLTVLVVAFAYLVSEQAQGVLRAAILSVCMVFVFSVVLRNIRSCAGWISLALLAILATIFGFVYRAPGTDWAYRVGFTIGMMVVTVPVGIAGAVLGMALGYVIGATVGLLRKSKYHIAV